jgi:hypothetical protein
MIVQADVDRAIPWTEPWALVIDWQNVRAGLGGGGRVFYVSLCDGFAHRLSGAVSDEQLRRLLQHQDGQRVDWNAIR